MVGEIEDDDGALQVTSDALQLKILNVELELLDIDPPQPSGVRLRRGK